MAKVTADWPRAASRSPKPSGKFISCAGRRNGTAGHEANHVAVTDKENGIETACLGRESKTLAQKR
jgi:hypothetical protein